MIGTNARTANGVAVIRRSSLREWLVRRLGESSARVCAVEPDGVVCAALTLDQVDGPESRLRDAGATPARWVRLV